MVGFRVKRPRPVAAGLGVVMALAMGLGCADDPSASPGAAGASVPRSVERPAAVPATPQDCIAQHPAPARFAPVVRALCTELDRHAGVSAAVVISVDDAVVFTTAVGPRCHGGAEPMDADTPVRIGSITKLVTAAAMLSIARAHGVGLDDPVPGDVVGLEAPATLGELLSHTSGLRDRDERTRLRLGARWREGIEQGRGSRGTRHYANVNFVVIGAWLEHLAGRPLFEWLQQQPGFAAVRSRVSSTPPASATGCGHRRGPEGRWVASILAREADLPPWVLPAGGGVATARQLAGLPKALAATGELGPMMRGDGRDAAYGFGVRRQQTPSGIAFTHTGRTAGHWSLVQWSADRRISVAVVSSTPQAFVATAFAAYEAALGPDPASKG